MHKKIAILFLFLLFCASISFVKAQTQEPSFRILTQSDSGDYIGQNKSWDFSNANNSKLSIQNANDSYAAFRTEDFAVSNMTFEFDSESGKTLTPGLHIPAKRYPFNDSYNGINISGDGRGCNTILGAFYVIEYALSNGSLQKAAIDFVQICEPGSSGLYGNTRPKLFGSLRYNSDIPDSCDAQGCREAKKNLGFGDMPETQFRIMTQSDSGDYIGQNKSWDFSNANNSKITILNASASFVDFKTEDFAVSNMTFEFDSESGKTLTPGLHMPAKRYPFNDSYNGINISGDGRGCNTILGAYYIHEYVLNNGNLEKAAIDFVQTCEPGTTGLYSNTRPKLYGSLRYNSDTPDSCDGQGCAEAKKNLGFNSGTSTPPSLTFTASPASISSGKGSILSWSSTNSSSCVSSGDGSAWGWPSPRYISGAQYTPALYTNQTYTMTCTGPAGSISKSVTVTVAEDTSKPDLIIKDIFEIPAELGMKGVRVKYYNQGATMPRTNFKINLKAKNGSYSSEATDNQPADFMTNEERYKDFSLEYGTYTLTATVDSDNIISELNDNNNTLEKTITIKSDATTLTINRLFTGQYNNVKYNVITADSDGISKIVLKRADGSVLSTGNPSCVKSLETGTVDLLPTDFPLTAYVNDCKDKTIVNTVQAEMPPIDSVAKPDLIITGVRVSPHKITIDNTTYDAQGLYVKIKNIGAADINSNFLFSIKTEPTTEYPEFGFIASAHLSSALGQDAQVNPFRSGEEKEFTLGGEYLMPAGFGQKTINCDLYVDNSFSLDHELIGGQIDEANENNNKYSSEILFYSPGFDLGINKINNNAKYLHEGKIQELLTEIKLLRDQLREQAAELKYLKTFAAEMRTLNTNMQTAIKAFIAYGVDDNTKKLGEGERAAVVSSYKAAFKKLPQTEGELADAIKIANGRWPSMTSAEAEKKAKEQFQKIFKRIADMNNPKDNAAITVMAYGLRQKAENRNLNSEKQGINTFKSIYGHTPGSTEDWNIMQAITYSGASRGTDTDGDLLIDSREKELGTNPNNKDSDGDGYIDGVEVANGFDPLKK